jgi:predicted RNA-binding protein YlxR (DUF448 family)
VINKKDLDIMALKKAKPIRMCIQCRSRMEQSSLLRLQCIDGELCMYKGFGRSFYICEDCQDNAKTVRHIMGRCKVPKQKFDEFTQKLREIFTNG